MAHLRISPPRKRVFEYQTYNREDAIVCGIFNVRVLPFKITLNEGHKSSCHEQALSYLPMTMVALRFYEMLRIHSPRVIQFQIYHIRIYFFLQICNVFSLELFGIKLEKYPYFYVGEQPDCFSLNFWNLLFFFQICIFFPSEFFGIKYKEEL